MEYLKVNENFGSTFKKDGDNESFFAKLVKFIERNVFDRISTRINFLLTRINDQKVEIIADGNDLFFLI